MISSETLADFYSQLKVELQQAWTMASIRINRRRDNLPVLLYALDNCITSESKEDKDVFYAVRALGANHWGPPEHPLPAPDYNLSLHDIFKQHLLFLLKTGSGASMIQRSGLQNGRQRIDALPSWWPAWLPHSDAQRPRRYIIDQTSNLEDCSVYYHSYESRRGRGWSDVTGRSLLIHAGRPVSPTVKWNSDITTVSVRGVLVGEVIDILATGRGKTPDTAHLNVLPETDQIELPEEMTDFIRRHTSVIATSEATTSRYSEMLQRPGVEMLQRPGVEMLQRPGVEMLQRPGVEMLQRPGVETAQRSGLGILQNPEAELLRRFSRAEILELKLSDRDKPCGSHQYLQKFLHNPLIGQTTCPGAFEIGEIMDRRVLISIAINSHLVPALLGLERQSTPPEIERMCIAGIGPCEARVGDRVVMFDDFATATIIRPVDDLPNARPQPLTVPGLEFNDAKRLHLVGDAYCMQLADGCVTSQIDDSACQDFILV